MRTGSFGTLEILEKISNNPLQFCSGNDNGTEVIVDLFTGSVAGNVAGFGKFPVRSSGFRVELIIVKLIFVLA